LAPASKPRRQNALGPKLSCSFQAAGSGAFGPAVAGVRDSVRRLPDVPRGSAEDSRDEPRATSSGCRGRSDDIPDLLRAFVGDSRRVAGVGTPVGYRRLAVDGRENEENYTCSRDSSRSGSRRLLRDPDESLRNNQTASNVQILETYLEFVLRPCQRALVDHWLRPTPPIMAPFFTGVNNYTHTVSMVLQNARTLPCAFSGWTAAFRIWPGKDLRLWTGLHLESVASEVGEWEYGRSVDSTWPRSFGRKSQVPGHPARL